MRVSASKAANPHPGQSVGPAGRPTALLQRKCACGGSAGLTGKCQDCAARESEARLGVVPLQAKLIVGAADDPYEREADRIADEVMRMPEPVAPRAPLPITSLVQRRTEPAVNTSAPGANTSTRADPAAGMAAPPIVHEVLASPGRPLDAATRAFFEPRFGRDLSHVRVHTDARAAESARAVGAAAYTVGAHLIFGAGRWAPATSGGRRLIGHELVHGNQQQSSGGLLQRQPNPLLDENDMFAIIVRERGWTFNAGGAPVEDPAGVGRRVGPAAGGRVAGHAVFSVIQVTDSRNNPIALSYGEHIRYGEPHAEQRAIAALNRHMPPGSDLAGGRMLVVVDQYPCPPSEADCLGLLQRYARDRRLNLEIFVPERERARGTGTVRPRTAAQGSQRRDLPPVRLVRVFQQAAGPTPAGGGSGGAARSRWDTPNPGTGTDARARSLGNAGVSPAARQRALAIVALQESVSEANRLNRFLRRLTGFLRVVGAFMEVLSAIDRIGQAQSLLTSGTTLPDQQRVADQIAADAEEIRNWAISVQSASEQQDLLLATALIENAISQEDAEALNELDQAYGDFAWTLMEATYEESRLRERAARLSRYERALSSASDTFLALAQIPQGATTAPNADQFAIHQSLLLLSGSVGTAARRYREATEALSIARFRAEFLWGLAYNANQASWALLFRDVAAHQRWYEQSLERTRRFQRHARRRAVAQTRVAEIESIVASSTSLSTELLLELQEERDRLQSELNR